MKHEEAELPYVGAGTKTNNSSNKIFYQLWHPEQVPRACILLVHGLAEHSSRYAEFAEYLTNHGYLVAALDLPGHGKSFGQHTYVDSFSDHQAAIMQLQQLIKQRYPDNKLFLLGHSMGGLLSSSLLILHPECFAAGILSGPALQSPLQPPAFQLFIIRLLAKLFPRLGVLQLGAEGVSRDPKVVDDYLADPLVYIGKISARCVSEMFKTMNFVMGRAAVINVPMLILHGEADIIAAAEGSKKLFNTISSDDKKLTIYPGLFHEILNEPERQQVYTDISDWLNVH